MSGSLRIGVMARGLAEAAGGVKEFIREITAALTRAGSPHEFFIYHAGREQLGAFPQAHERALRLSNRFLADHWETPRLARADKLDVLFCPKHIVPRGIGVSAKPAAVVAIYDLGYYGVDGRGEYRALEAAYMRAMMPGSARRARAVATLSEHMRGEIARQFSMSPEKIFVVPPGVAARFRPLPRERARETARRYGVTGPYIFHAGSLSPRKNVTRLLEAFSRLLKRLPHELVLTGGKSWRDGAARRRLAAAEFGGRTRLLGCVEDADMPALYAAADVFVYPSLHEGYGLPVVEAMACGCPVVASNASAVPEAAGGAARLVDPYSPAAIAAAIAEVVENAAARARLTDAGLRRAAKLSWSASAARLIEVFERAAASANAGRT